MSRIVDRAVHALAHLAMLLSLPGCDGLGRPIVGSEVLEPGEEIDRCGVQFACEPVATLPADHFDVPMLPTSRATTDCDDDLVDDSIDNCIGVWNPVQAGTECQASQQACSALLAGELSFVEADLRGCRIETPIVLTQGASFEGADLRCASLRFVAETQTQLELRGAQINTVELEVDGPVLVGGSDTRFANTSVHLRGGAKLSAARSIWNGSGIWMDPGPTFDSAASEATLDLSASALDGTTIVEPPSSRPGRVRLDESTLSVSRVSVPVFEAISSSVRLSQLDVNELDLVNTEVEQCQVESEQVVIAASELLGVIFDRCDDVVVASSTLRDVDVPQCEPEAFYVRDSTIEGARLGGGLLLDDSDLFSSIVGGAAGSVMRSMEATLDGVKFCDLEAGAFAGGEMRCVTCDETSFHGGATVCLDNVRLVERGCTQIEFAPSCH